MADELLFQPVKRGTKTQWDAEDNKSSGYRLPARALGLDMTNNLLKVGDGSSKFGELPNLNAEKAIRINYKLPHQDRVLGGSGSNVGYKMTDIVSKDYYTPGSGKIRILFPPSVTTQFGYLTIKLLIYFYDSSSTTEVLITGYPKSGNSILSTISSTFRPWNQASCNISNTNRIKTCEIGIYDSNGTYDDNNNFVPNLSTARWGILLGNDDNSLVRCSILIEEVIGTEKLCNLEDFSIDIYSPVANGEDLTYWRSDQATNKVQNIRVNYSFSAYDMEIINNLTTKNLTVSNNATINNKLNTKDLEITRKGQVGNIIVGSFSLSNGTIIGTGVNFGANSFVAGKDNGTSSNNSNKIILGSDNFSSGLYQCLMGTNLVGPLGNYYTILGISNSTTSMSSEDFVIGNGYSGGLTTRNAVRITSSNELYSSAAWNTSGADYAEYFEWEDGNPNNEDRVGLFVANSNGKIKIANSTDFILGIVSANPSCVGGNPEEWDDRFLKDIYGRIITEDEIIEDSYQEVEIETGEFDEDGNPLTETQQILIKGHIHKKPIENPEYNKEREYVARNRRKEWAPIGLIGQLVVRDDGTCQPDSFCTCGNNGIATSTLNSTRFRVLKRLDDSHIKILIL